MYQAWRHLLSLLFCKWILVQVAWAATYTSQTASNYIGIGGLERTWDEAQSYCQSTYGTSLATMRDSSDQAQMERIADKMNTGNEDGSKFAVGYANTDDAQKNIAWAPCARTSKGDCNCCLCEANPLYWDSSWHDQETDFNRNRCGYFGRGGGTSYGKWVFDTCGENRDFVCNHPNGEYGTDIACSPTPDPTQKPTPQPTDSPTETPTTVAPTSAPTRKPTKSPIFGRQDYCNRIYVDMDSNGQSHAQDIDESVADATFEIFDFEGIDDHLYWSRKNENGSRIYFNGNMNGWMIEIANDSYMYNGSDNDTYYPPIDRDTIWNRFDINNHSINDSEWIRLYLQCSDFKSVIFDDNNETWEWTTYIVVGVVMSWGILMTIIAFIVHSRKKGADAPSYLAFIRCSLEISDIFTDCSYVWSVYLAGYPWLYVYVPALLIVGPYILSILTALYKIFRFKRSDESSISGYMKRFDKLWITVTLMIGFYTTFQLFTSHLFHLEVTSLQVARSEKQNVKTSKIINFVLIENLGLFVTQVFFLIFVGFFSGSLDSLSSTTKITLLSLLFSCIAITRALLIILSRFLYFCSNGCAVRNKFEYFYLEIMSKHITANHEHSHFLVEGAISKAIGVDISAIETLIIVKKGNGISCKIRVNILNAHDRENCQQLFDWISSTKKSLKRELTHALKIENIKSMQLQRIMALKDTDTRQTTEIPQTLQKHTEKKERKKERKKKSKKYDK